MSFFQLLLMSRFSLSLSIQHICGERMLVDLYRLLSFGGIELNSPRLYSRLQLLTEHFAFICIMRCCIMPLTILDFL